MVEKHKQKGAEYLAKVFSSEAWSEAPEWNEAESGRLAQYCVDMGFEAQQIAAETRPQVFVEARRALLARDGVSVGRRKSPAKKVRMRRKASPKQEPKERRVNTDQPHGFYKQVDKISEILSRG